MFSVPLQLPLKASEAASLAGLIFQHVQGRKLDNDLRSRLGARIQALGYSSIAPLAASVQRDPIHPDAYYVVADSGQNRRECWLLRLALASSPSSGLFPNSVLIGRMRTSAGVEVVINAIPFGPGDNANIRTFAERVDPAFLPRPQGAAPSISVEHDHLQASLPSTFETYREILTSTGINLAAVPVRDQAQVDAVLWAAIRAGWREGYTLETDLKLDAASTDQVPVACTRFTVQAHQGCEQIEFMLRQIRTLVARKFDLEVEFDRELSTPETIDACLRFLKSRDRQVQLVTPHLDALSAWGDIANIARQHGALLGIRSVGLLPATVLQQIGRATGGKLSYRICQPITGEPARLIAIAQEKLRS